MINAHKVDSVLARPFVKWVGGKSSIADKIIEEFPNEINNYYEPFAGGGSIFFKVASRVKHAYLSDNNLDLMLTYQAIKKRSRRIDRQTLRT